MHVCFTNLWHPPGVADADALVEADGIRRGFGAALVARGHRVTVVQEAPWPGAVTRDGVEWVLVPPSPFTVASRRALGRLGHPSPQVPAPATSLPPVVERLRPDLVHSFDLPHYASLALLGDVARRLRVPLVAHFHGGAPARHPAWRIVERRALAGVSRLLFTSRARGLDWVRSGALPDDARIVELFETSTAMRASSAPSERAAARDRARMPGSPVFLCAGRLDPVKDPLTTLAGFARIARVRPDARLVLAWNDAPMEADVRRSIASDPVLAPRVELRGHVPHAEMRDLYAGADALLQSSVREVCGVAVLEALACGAVPVLTDIPPFRRLTDDGRVGRLFPRGDGVALAAQALALLDGDLPAASAAARAWFDRALTFEVLAAELEAVYRAAISHQETGSTRTGRAASAPAASRSTSSG
ncbi:MAG: glycosyltransferase family 4 protein [Pseudomonadota bacterium]|nr:glycosyltransferase family 4 protein [Pseudomonadota bacterium]